MSVESRVAEQVAAAARRRVELAQVREVLARRRAAGLSARHTVKLRRQEAAGGR